MSLAYPSARMEGQDGGCDCHPEDDMTTTEITPEEFGVETDRGAASLSRIVELDALIKTLESERTALKDALRMELTANPDPIADLEHGIVATLTERRKPAAIDLITMAKHPEHEANIVEAARTGLLSAALTPLRAMKGKSPAADALLSYEMPGGVDYILRIEEVK